MLLTRGLVVVAGEVTTSARLEVPRIVRALIKNIGYTDASYGLDGETCGLQVSLQEQSADIALGVGKAVEAPEKIGAGDQGIMYGYATDETPEYMPLSLVLAHKLTRRLAELRKKGILKYLRPDGKSQVTVEYMDGAPARIHTVLISTQHAPEVSLKKIREDVIKHVIAPMLPKSWLIKTEDFVIQRAGS